MKSERVDVTRCEVAVLIRPRTPRQASGVDLLDLSERAAEGAEPVVVFGLVVRCVMSGPDLLQEGYSEIATNLAEVLLRMDSLKLLKLPAAVITTSVT